MGHCHESLQCSRRLRQARKPSTVYYGHSGRCTLQHLAGAGARSVKHERNDTMQDSQCQILDRTVHAFCDNYYCSNPAKYAIGKGVGPLHMPMNICEKCANELAESFAERAADFPALAGLAQQLEQEEEPAEETGEPELVAAGPISKPVRSQRKGR